MSKELLPEFIKKLLPEADIPFKGINAWIAQGSNFQIVFLDINPITSIPPHTHGEQFGVVLEGEMSLTIGEKTNKYVKGDTYHIPRGVEHKAEFHTQFKALDFFEDSNRYSPKV
ncbi:MAG: cupin domain-containing protein [Candidatus Heimdallarchaeota archaeon]|nr:cupin domain-containing protein [Candidatus Heimdallarchaeota archaeon]